MSLARLDGETLGYGQRPVLREVQFALSRGEHVVLLGRSGAGKSTLLSRVYTQTSATDRVALVPQDHALVPQLSVARNVLMGRLDDHAAWHNLRTLVWLSGPEREGIRAYLDLVGLSDLAPRKVEALSGGQKQRVALARALCRGGALLVGDEPVSAVDETQGAALIEQLQARFDTTLTALHDVGLARRYATRLVGIGRGAILFDAPPSEVSDAQLADLYAA
ncbi:ATP-binding cassette domain-containing protein [Pseudooceanicola sp. CBS1P-1]|uniref:ATP-binding cassette domain-containing protein n=1 Tax=Pseudooceanicola albus TaxID=2692189 RepID=A0A6L7G2P5_9RHOB|nr:MULTISPECIES: ATP-binding cassette domain-containing protein [Pseudooceanicola]MBT9383816.1 ATP-binding cassette domain-containing protein [Pseudooceanicola endophyticus]MXN17670.1 ATP-binding cassette domain-containing protein [Pseudooceanicola albus]